MTTRFTRLMHISDRAAQPGLAFRQWRAGGMTARGAGDRRPGSSPVTGSAATPQARAPGHLLQQIVSFPAVNNLFDCSWVTGSGQVHR